MNQVTIYTTTTCPYCTYAKEFFKQQNISYTEKNVGLDRASAMEMIMKSGQMGVPVIDINGSVVIGYQPNRFMELLNK